MYRFNGMLFYEMIENLHCQGCRIQQPIDKKTLTDRGTLLCVLKYFKSNEACLLRIFSKKIVPKFVCSMATFSMPAILDRSLHLASQTIMYLRVSYFLRYCDKTPKICCYGLIACYFIFKKCLV